MHIIGRVFDGLVLTINVVVILIFILSAYSDRISPNSIIYPSFLGILFPFFLLILLGFTIYWALRLKVYALISLAALLICWEPVTRYIPYHMMRSDEQPGSLKLLTYNTCGMGSYNHGTRENSNNVLKFIQEQNADIVCLQEYTFVNEKGALSEKKIRKALSNYPYYHFSSASANYTNSGLAIFSKYPITRSKAIEYKSIYNNSCLYEVNVKGKKITVINNHLESNKLSPEDRKFYNSVIKNFETDKIPEIRSTLIHKLGAAYRIRALQAEKLKGIIANVKTPVIVCGDLNDTPISYCYQTIRGPLKDAYRNSGFGLGITYHENNFLFRIDHIFHSASIHSYNAEVHHVNYSDHYPVTVSLDLPE